MTQEEKQAKIERLLKIILDITNRHQVGSIDPKCLIFDLEWIEKYTLDIISLINAEKTDDELNRSIDESR